jgi:alpha-1,2-glucosyltransferase
VIKVAMPYIILLLLFTGFVVWNGSVVLGKRFHILDLHGNLTAVGDKSAHTATIHLPQMLYIWPYIAFFSAPLLVGPLLRPVLPILPKRLQAICEDYVNASKYGLPTFLTSGLFITLGLIAVYFNTIIHPYTLADNRHYGFYVFKIFRLYPAIKYLAVPVYFVCAWLTIQSLASPSLVGQDVSKTKREDRPTNDKAERQPCQVSFITIWLATTALSTVTAPLVEPRYFIIPWLIWRLHVPCSLASLSRDRSKDKATYDMRLVLETFWLLATNAAVSYTFLYRTFIWPSEPANLQRFIW